MSEVRRDSPRTRRLRSDRRALAQLQSESSIFRFEPLGEPADYYKLYFHGKGLWRPDGQASVYPQERHEVHVRLGAAYPRMMPELGWKSPIFHPNISASGVVCLGGYGTYWVPSLTLDDLCGMLWDMIRYANYDENSPYNRDAAQWLKTQGQYRLPLDERPLRDRLAGYVPQTVPAPVPAAAPPPPREPERAAHPPRMASPPRPANPFRSSPGAFRPPPLPANRSDDVIFLDETDIIPTPAESSDDILFIE